VPQGLSIMAPGRGGPNPWTMAPTRAGTDRSRNFFQWDSAFKGAIAGWLELHTAFICGSRPIDGYFSRPL